MYQLSYEQAYDRRFTELGIPTTLEDKTPNTSRQNASGIPDKLTSGN